jgi:hypothetical protein
MHGVGFQLMNEAESDFKLTFFPWLLALKICYFDSKDDVT